MDKNEQKALDDIEEYGCHILGILEEDDEPRFTYSIGINKKLNKPDLIILGLKHDLAHEIANDYYKRVLNGELFEEGVFYQDFLEGFDVCFVKVNNKHFKEYTGWATWLHDGDDYEYLQLVWPTTQNHWPWDEDTSDFYQWSQPILNEDGVLNKL